MNDDEKKGDKPGFAPCPKPKATPRSRSFKHRTWYHQRIHKNFIEPKPPFIQVVASRTSVVIATARMPDFLSRSPGIMNPALRKKHKL